MVIGAGSIGQAAARRVSAGKRHPGRAEAVGALLLSPDGAFITGSDFLMDGGATAA